MGIYESINGDKADEYFNKSVENFNHISEDYFTSSNIIYNVNLYFYQNEVRYFPFSGMSYFWWEKINLCHQYNSTPKKIYYLLPCPIGQCIYGNYSKYSSLQYPFMDYVIKNKKAQKLYSSKGGMDALNIFLRCYYENTPINKIKPEYYEFAIQCSNENPFTKDVLNANFNNLVLSLYYFEKADTVLALKYFNTADKNLIFSHDYFKDVGFRDANVDLIRKLAVKFAINETNKNVYFSYIIDCKKANYLQLSFKAVKALPDLNSQIGAYTDIIYNLQEYGMVENTFIYLDSAFILINDRVINEYNLYRVFGLIGGIEMYSIADKEIKNLKDGLKPTAFQSYVKGISENGFYYKAYDNVPKTFSPEMEFHCINEILFAEIYRNFKDKKQFKLWEKFNDQKHKEVFNYIENEEYYYYIINK